LSSAAAVERGVVRQMNVETESVGVLILAAGKGIRMHSEKPKVLHSLLEEPLLYYPIKAAIDAGLRDIVALVGYGGEAVKEYLNAEWPAIDVIWQREQLGTGHAVMISEDWWRNFKHVMVIVGDVPLVTSESLSLLIRRHLTALPQCSFLSFMVEDASGYGRVVRLADGGVRIIEEHDALEEELLVHEINSGVYIFERDALLSVIRKIGRDNEQSEYYLTEAIHIIGDTEGDVNVIICEDGFELLGVNTSKDLARTARALNDKILGQHMGNGLKCMDPSSVWIGPRVEFGSDVIIEPGAQIWGKSRIGGGSRIGAYSTLRNVTMGENSVIVGPSVINDVTIGSGVEIGPFAYMRCGAEIKDDARIGRFVEIKNSSIGADSKVPHLSYIGDADIGDHTNIGAGSITCNYDGKDKHRTNIGSGCFVGSDTMFVAPVRVGDNSFTAAGSVVTKDVPQGALAVARTRQANIENWAETKDKNNLPDEVNS
jgi:bifunctional UDP-N-acetylglucosamine pyrophosphorylase/glucosamine-1-phosphate N-acetyltransferase